MEEVKPTFRKGTVITKGWGYELVFANNPKYCGKELHFNAGNRFSMHYHLRKEETFYIRKGRICFHYFDLTTAKEFVEELGEGTVIDIPIGCPHQIAALTDVVIVEVSTTHFDEDNYRIRRGDSQK